MGGISVSGLTKQFGAVTALAGIDLEVDSGEAVVLVGPNGAGKSTLLRILSTTVLPDGGRATVAGYDVERDPVAVRRSIGLLLPDERAWYWRLTGRANLEFFAALHGLRRRAAVPRVEILLADAGLASAADRPVSGYSSGMRLRLALARALLVEPPVLLLDEPTRSLDPVAARRFRGLVDRIVDEQGSAVLFATHDLHEATAVGTRVVIIDAGRIAAVVAGGGSPETLEQLLGARTG